MARVRVDGKQFALGEHRFPFRGVTYGTFEPREDGARFPGFDRVKRDFSAMHEAGFTVVRTYTAPPDDVVSLASDWDLKLLAGVFYPDWRYLVGDSRRGRRRVAREARATVRATARRLAGHESVLGLCLGNEVPADVVRWFGTDAIREVIDELAEVVRDEDPELLVTYANFPSTEYLRPERMDFVTFNVFLEDEQAFGSYLLRLHNLAGDRPLVLGEIGLHTGGSPEDDARQAGTIDWMLRVAMERGVAGSCLFSWTDEWWVGDAAVEGWHFGLTDAARTPRPALRTAATWNRRTLANLRDDWPSISVVICAYNSASTLDECVRHATALDYPGLEVIVVDDGSTDGTAEIVRRNARAGLVTIPHGGLSVARNAGFRAAKGSLVAYLDSDAFPAPEWPYYLALGMEGDEQLAGVGGPNVPPAGDGTGAQVVARAPGGPVHVLVADDRAEHVPGCNMAFRRGTLEELGGFDPVYVAAGDDVDFCWRVLDRGWKIGFHPAALVWHHRRSGIRTYLRQQVGYGRAEALVEARHPHRFTARGTARWRGRIYNPVNARLGGSCVYRGMYGSAAYQSVYQGGGYALDLVHQAGVPQAVLLALTAPLALVSPWLGLPAAVAILALLGLVAVDSVRADVPRGTAPLPFRIRVGILHLLQPLARTWGRVRHARAARGGLDDFGSLPSPAARVDRGTVLLPEALARPELTARVVVTLRRAGLHVGAATGWEDHDGVVVASSMVCGELVTSAHPIGSVQLRVRPRLRRPRAVLAAVVAAAALFVSPAVGALLVAAAAAEVTRGWWRAGPKARRAILAASGRAP